jgi:hypothetical protein
MNTPTNLSNLQFIEHVKKECKKFNIKCSLRSGKYVKLSNSIRCGGWFDDEKKELVVAMGREDFMEILVHEYSHMQQSIEDVPCWRPGADSCAILDEWLNGKNVPNINSHIDNVRIMELDNEKRSVQLIKKYGLNIDLDLYIKKANAYMHFYNWLKESRKWSSPNNSPYKNANILNMMSTKFNMKYDVLPLKIKKVFIQENI